MFGFRKYADYVKFTILGVISIILSTCFMGCTENNNVSRLEILERECVRAVKNWEYDRADSLSMILVAEAKKEGNKEYLAKGLLYSGSFRPGVDSLELDRREYNLQQAESIAVKMRLIPVLARVYNSKGIWEVNRRHDYITSQFLLQTAMKYSRECGDRELENSAEANYSYICQLLGDTIDFTHNNEQFRYAAATHNDKLLLVSGYNCCQYLMKQGSSEEALKYYTDKMQPADSVDKFVPLIYARYFYNSGDYENAYKWILKSDYDVSHLAAMTYADILNKIGKFEESNSVADLVLKCYENQNFNEDWVEMYRLMAANYKGMGNYEKALDYSELFSRSIDSIYTRRNEEIIKRLKIEFETDKKDIDIRNKKHHIDSLRWTIMLLVFIFLVVIIAYSLYVRKRNRLYKDIVKQVTDSHAREETLKEMLNRKESELAKFKDVPGEEGMPKETPESENKEHTIIDDNKIEDIFRRIQYHMEVEHIWKDKNITRETFADLIKCNRTYFTEVIKIKTNQSYSQFMNSYRVREATRILSDIDSGESVSMKEIAERAGFTSISSFYSIFRQTVGMSPSAFRKTASSIMQKQRESR